MRRLKHLLEYTAVITLLPLLSIIPYRLRLKIGSFLGTLTYYLYRHRRVIALENLSYAYPDKDRKWQHAICKKSFQHLGMNAMEFIQLPKLNERFLQKYFRIEGEEHFIKALEKKKGVIVIGPHLGNWEFIIGYFGLKGYKGTAIMKRQSNPYLNRMIRRFRNKFNLSLIYRKEARREIPRALLEYNHLVGFGADQDAGSRGVFVDFLGRPASTATGPARFAMICQSPAVLIISYREKDLCRIKISPFLPFDYSTDNQNSAILKNTEIWTQKAEEYIRKYPEQYLWAHDRWKTKKSDR